MMKIAIDPAQPGANMTTIAISMTQEDYAKLVADAERFRYLVEECRDRYSEHDQNCGVEVQLVFPEPGVNIFGWRERLIKKIDEQRGA